MLISADQSPDRQGGQQRPAQDGRHRSDLPCLVPGRGEGQGQGERERESGTFCLLLTLLTIRPTKKELCFLSHAQKS